MSEHYLQLTLNDFLNAITNKENEYTVRIGNLTLTANYGTIEEFLEEDKDLDRQVLSGKSRYTYEKELSHIEICNYLEKITGGFDTYKTKITLSEIESYYSVFIENIDRQSIQEYEENGWDIPRIKPLGIVKELIEFVSKDKLISLPDHKKMRERTHPYDGWNIQYAIHLLKSKLEVGEKYESNTNNTDNSYYQIFSDNEYKLFTYLNDNYTIDNKSLKAKYSNIYHFLKYENCISGTQLKYIDFVLTEYDLSMSKILQQNYKYKDDIQPLLTRLYSRFKQQKEN